jgi:serine/threonine-protein kinase
MATCPSCRRDFESAVFCPNDGARLVAGAPDTGDRSGQIIENRYRLVRPIGSGAMGEVYEAEHIYINKRVALKLLHRHLVTNTEAVQRLHREARSTSGIGHPNIVHIEDFGHAEDGAVYLAMEWLEGETLRDRLERGPLPIPDALAIMSAIASGVAASHASGVIHRDLKPANIFLARQRDGSEVVKVLDFGIAKLAAGDASLTQTGAFIGTPHYMAPEQADATRVDGRSDVYSMGVILYELACGQIPFGGDSVVAVLQQHAGAAPTPPRKRAPERGISAELEAIILRALAKRSDERYSDALAFKAAVDAQRERSATGARRNTDRGMVAHSGSAASAPEPAPAPSPAPTVVSAPRDQARRPRRPSSAPGPAPEDSFDLSIPGGKRRRWPLVLALGALAAGAIGGGGYLLLGDGGSGGENPAASIDAGTAVATDPPDAAAPAASRWTFRGETAGTHFEATTTPSVLAAGEPFVLQLALEAHSPAVTDALASGAARLSLRYVYYKGHSTEDGGTHRVTTGGALAESEQVSLGKPGKYHVTAVLMHGGETVWTGKFDICVGADPEGPRAKLDRVCPRLNANR